MSLSRKKRLIENEVIFREVNKEIQEFITEEKGSKQDEKIDFYCECSRPDCIERISLMPRAYKALHKTKKQFVIISGHDFPEIEKIIKAYGNYKVVEKFYTPPKAKDINLALNSISESL